MLVRQSHEHKVVALPIAICWEKVIMRRYASVKAIVLSLVLTAQITLLPSEVIGQSSGFGITPIVRRGDPVSDGGRFFDCDLCEGRVVGFHALNNKGDVAIGADTTGSCNEGRFLVSSGSSIRLADFCQQTPFGKLGILGSVNINQQSDAAMLVGVPVSNRVDAALLLRSNGQITKLVQEGDASPAGTIFKGCGFSAPSINNRGEVAFSACGETPQGFFRDGAFVYSGGQMRKVVLSGEPSPVGGEFVINFIPAPPVKINDNGEVLFLADVILNSLTQKLGLWMATSNGFNKILFDDDPMPASGLVMHKTFANADLNNNGYVAFSVRLEGGNTDSGIFLYSNGQISKIMAEGDSSPIGGKFSSLLDPELREDFPTPRMNGNGAVAFKVRVTGGNAPSAIFLASPSAIVKVVAVGDQLPTGETIRVIDTFALNDLGQVAFFAYGKKDKTKPLGVYLATPPAPAIASIKLKSKKGSLQLRVNGNAMITNDTVIEINGVPLGAIDYPSDFREDGGTTTQLVSRDSRLEQLIPSGQTVQVMVYNSLTNLRSAPRMFTRD